MGIVFYLQRFATLPLQTVSYPWCGGYYVRLEGGRQMFESSSANHVNNFNAQSNSERRLQGIMVVIHEVLDLLC